MESYRKTLMFRICALSFVVVFAVALGIFDVFFAAADIKTSPVFGFQCGATLALGVLALPLIVRYKRALTSEENRRRLFHQENDERMKAIKAKAGMPLLWITSFLMIIAAVVTGYFHVVVFYTLMAVSVCQLAIACIVKFIYMRLM